MTSLETALLVALTDVLVRVGLKELTVEVDKAAKTFTLVRL